MASAHSMPSKVYEIMASGRPLLASADRDSDLWRLVVETGCGLIVEPRDSAGLAMAILRLYMDSSLRESMGERGRLLAMEHYSRSAVIGQYEDVLRRCVNSGAPPASAGTLSC
jgi:colanic acid biosynthesis glycosyl transferase WcaI